MKATDYPSDVPVPRPYDVDGDKISHSAEYRAQIERLKALGYWPHDTEAHPGGAAFYISLMRALNRLEQAEAEVVTLREAHETLTQENAKHEKYWQEERAGLRERVKFTEPYESVLLQKEQAEAEVVTLRETVQAAEEVVRLREVRLEELAGEVVTLRETLAAEKDGVMECVKALDRVFTETPNPATGEWDHHTACSGSRRLPPGTPGSGCVCLRSKKQTAARLSDLVARLRGLPVRTITVGDGISGRTEAQFVSKRLLDAALLAASPEAPQEHSK